MSKRTGSTFKHGRNGYTNYGCRCDTCRSEMSEVMRAYNAANPERNRAKAKAWAEANPERARAAARARRLRNIERERERLAAWKRANPHKVYEGVRKRRAQKAGGDSRVVTERDWLRLCARYDGRCAYCGGAGPLTQDHVIPLRRGGRHAIGNLLPACGTCNGSKGTRLLVEWRRLTLSAAPEAHSPVPSASHV